MEEWFDMNVDECARKRERGKARDLRRTKWFQALLDRGICHYCGRKFSRAELTMDHIVPVARGGRSVKGNVVVACKECNSRKKYLTPVEIILAQNEQKDPEND